MGMFDSAYIVVKCPQCGNEAELECQSKDKLWPSLEVWRVGDFVDAELTELDTICECRSEQCLKPPQYPGIQSIRSGYYFNPIIKLKDGYLTSEYTL